MKTHAIFWKSNNNGKIGCGTILFEKEEAERLAAELNRDYPEITHHAVLAPLPAELFAPEPTASGSCFPVDLRL